MIARTASTHASPPKPAPTLARLQALVAQDLKQVDNVIFTHLHSGVPLIAQLAGHIIASGGKRLRPALVLLCAKLCGYEGMRHIHLAACVEFIHTATLLHDDVVDESKLRRGSATANDVWGNKASVLVGDFLLSRAFQLMVADKSLAVLRILSDASAIIAQGEVMQISTANNLATTEAEYLQVVEAKTSALFAAACELGAVVSEQPEKEQALRVFGMNIGNAFQLVDDVLDYSANQALLGKSIGDDFREGKVTLPVITAYEKGAGAEKTFWERTIQTHEQQEGDFEKAVEYITRHGGHSYALAQAERYCQTARNALDAFPPSEEKTALLEIVDFCLQRAY